MYQTNTLKKLKNVNKELKGFKIFLTNFERDGQFLNKLEQYAESIQNGIKSFKSEAANEYENIQDEIDLISRDVNNLEKNIEHWKEIEPEFQKVKEYNFKDENQEYASEGPYNRLKSLQNP
jgi:Sec-independent protein translocase protein TatA